MFNRSPYIIIHFYHQTINHNFVASEKRQIVYWTIFWLNLTKCYYFLNLDALVAASSLLLLVSVYIQCFLFLFSLKKINIR